MRIALLALFAAAMFPGSPVIAHEGDTKLYASLDGNSATTPNSSYATGIFTGRVNPASGELCYKLTSQNLALLTKAEIGLGGLGVAGLTAVTLLPDSPRETCIGIEPALAEKLASHPRGYFVQISTRTFPDGVIRGQLMK